MKSIALLLGNALAAALLALVFFALFEVATERAFGLLMPFMVLPVLGLTSIEWLLITGFVSVFILAVYLGTRLLPDEALSGHLLSFLLGLYLVYVVVLLTVIFVTLPDTIVKGTRFMGLARPMLMDPGSMLFFALLVPGFIALPAFKKRKLSLITIKGEAVRLSIILVFWALAIFVSVQCALKANF